MYKKFLSKEEIFCRQFEIKTEKEEVEKMEYAKQMYGNKTNGINGNVGAGTNMSPAQHIGLAGRRLPEKSFKSSGISVSIWQNPVVNKNGQPGVYQTVSLDKRYMDKNGVWQSSGSFRINDLPKVTLLLNKAFEYIVLKQSQYQAENTTGIVKDEELIEEEVVI